VIWKLVRFIASSDSIHCAWAMPQSADTDESVLALDPDPPKSAVGRPREGYSSSMPTKASIRAGMASPPLEHERDSLPQPSDRVGAPHDDGAGPTSMTAEAPRAPTAAVEGPMA
jgi:hypothetical protein